MDETLARRFGDRRVPRYTSYPTAPHFTAAIDEKAYRSWLGSLAAPQRLSLYLHVPFCRSLCWYCGCHTRVAGSDEPIRHYCSTLLAELDLLGAALPGRLAVTHVHWGGGTPTIIGAKRFAAVMARLGQAFALAAEAEVAVEIDPRNLDQAMIEAMAGSGVNRASLGVQSFDPEVQQAVNRTQTYDATAGAVAALRQAGITRLNLDLIYGLPHETVASCRATVAATLALAPDRLAVFGYAHLPSLLRHQRLIDETALPDVVERFRQYSAIADDLVAAGYVPIGLDHFARRDDALATAAANGRLRRNFQGYTTDNADALFGLGASAIGALPQGYVQNAVPIREWRSQVEAGHLPIARGVALSADDRLRRDIIERLMCDMRVDLQAAVRHHGVAMDSLATALAALKPLADEGIVRLEDHAVAVPAEARPFLRSVAAAFDAHLDGSAGRHSRGI